MIKVHSLTKKFGKFTALDGISCDISDGSIYGLVGINGSGKSTLLRTITGIYRADDGEVTFDGEGVYDNPEVKKRIAFVPDELYLPNNETMLSMSKKYNTLYNGKFNRKKFDELSAAFSLDVRKPLNTFSKGMRRQASTILALSLETDYIFFDETFDGLDPFKRAYVKRLIEEDVRSRGATAIITSHSLKELEDICDKLAVLDKGGIVLESDVSDMSVGGVKVQIAFSEDYDETKFDSFDLIEFSKHGSVSGLIIKGEESEIKEKLSAMSPILLETLPLSLEDVFTLELTRRGVETFSELLKKEDEEV